MTPVEMCVWIRRNLCKLSEEQQAIAKSQCTRAFNIVRDHMEGLVTPLKGSMRYLDDLKLFIKGRLPS